MKKAAKWLFISFLIVTVLAGAYTALVFLAEDYYNSKAANLVVDPSLPTEDLKPGDRLKIQFTTENTGYHGTDARHILVLSLYDRQGQPLTLDGSSTTCSAYDLFAQDADTMPLAHKAIQGNQAIYALEEFSLSAADRRITNPFHPTAEDLRPVSTTNEVILAMDADAAERYTGCIVTLDILTQIRQDNTQEWCSSGSGRLVIGDGGSNLSDLGCSEIPVLTESRTYHWEIRNGTARLAGIGSVTETDLVLPTSVMLSPGPELTEGYRLNPALMEQGEYFLNCGTAYEIECHDGTVITDRTVLKESTYFAAKLLVYDAEAFAAGLENGEFPSMKLSLKNGTYFQTSALGYTIYPEDYSREKPLVLTIAPNTDSFQYIEDPINGTLYPVELLGDAFFDCDSIISVTFQEDAVLVENKLRWSNGGMFSRCDALTAVYNIPDEVTDMHRAFEDCPALSETPVLPQSVTDLSHCFSGCTSLPEIPEIPSTVTNLYTAFYGCSSVTGTATVPAGVVDPTDYMPLYSAFFGCDGLEQIYFESCPLFPYAIYATNLPVEYLQEHVAEGTCPHCKTVNQNLVTIDDIMVVADSIPSSHYEAFVEYLDEEVPDLLKESCERMTLTTDLGKYNSAYVNEPLVLGYAIWPSCYTYIKIDPAEELPRETILHELAHCYDYTYADDTFLRDTEEWIQIHKANGYYASLWYNQEAYNELSESDQRGETFAIAVELYFEYPSWLQQYCPRMYEYADNLFGDE